MGIITSVVHTIASDKYEAEVGLQKSASDNNTLFKAESGEHRDPSQGPKKTTFRIWWRQGAIPMMSTGLNQSFMGCHVQRLPNEDMRRQSRDIRYASLSNTLGTTSKRPAMHMFGKRITPSHRFPASIIYVLVACVIAAQFIASRFRRWAARLYHIIMM